MPSPPRALIGGLPALQKAAAAETDDVMREMDASPSGLTTEEAVSRLHRLGPNTIVEHRVRRVAVLARQLRSPLLLLLAATAALSYVFADKSSAVIIFGILAASIGLSYMNEYRSEVAVAELRARIRHRAVVLRDGRLQAIDVIRVVPGDIVALDVGDIVPADVRLLEVNALECDEAVLTGEAMTAAKTSSAVPPEASALKLPSCAFMGTVVRGGTARGLVVQTGLRTVLGHVAQGLNRRPPETAFQRGLRQFSIMLIWVTAVLVVSIFVLNAVLGRPILQSALFSLAIAVGLTPQLLPATVTTSLAFGARRLAQASVLVKRLIAIEDLGNIEVLFTDKTGTLTEGSISFRSALDARGELEPSIWQLGLVCNSAKLDGTTVVGGNPLDRALWEADGRPSVEGFSRLHEAPFDYDRKLMSVLVDDASGRRLIVTKGAPEMLMSRCANVPQSANDELTRLFDEGSRVVAVGCREASGVLEIGPATEVDLAFRGFLVFTDPVKLDAAEALDRLRGLGVTVKIVTGDNARVASKVCRDLGLEIQGTLNGSDIDGLDDDSLAAAIATTTIFARVTPEQKSRIILRQRALHKDVAFLGDGVNDAVAMHDADVGISVESATDVAKDAADIVLLQKDLGVLATGVIEGRRIFSNTIKYVLMATSSNFGNMFSAAGASLILPFLPMTSTQILLNNLLYDVSELTIPSDRVDDEMLRRPAAWDNRFVRRFMIAFGPISSIFDFLTFGVMIWIFKAGAHLFQTGWFVESLATQTLIIFVIRTRRVPFFRSRPGRALAITSITCVVIGAGLPFVPPVAHLFGFTPLPPTFFLILLAMVITYLVLVEIGKAVFFRWGLTRLAEVPDEDARHRQLHRRWVRWSRPRHHEPASHVAPG
ncbi:MAG TPA: magnesium-translocating P-type ATPase [Candidatus Acidoferrales bacterium]|nr:magnesium-translocating P-type ATPase [Candidatus Acidoferrales bacterium]